MKKIIIIALLTLIICSIDIFAFTFTPETSFLYEIGADYKYSFEEDSYLTILLNAGFGTENFQLVIGLPITIGLDNRLFDFQEQVGFKFLFFDGLMGLSADIALSPLISILDSFSFTAELGLEVYFPLFSPDDGIAIGAGIGYRGFVPMFDYIPKDEDFRNSFGYVNAVLSYFHKS